MSSYSAYSQAYFLELPEVTLGTGARITPEAGSFTDCQGYCLNEFDCLAVEVPVGAADTSKCVFFKYEDSSCAKFEGGSFPKATSVNLYFKSGYCTPVGQASLFVSIAVLLVFMVSMGFAFMERKKEFVKLFSLPIMFCFYLGLMAMLAGASISYYVPVVASALMDLSLIFSLSCLGVHFLRMYLVVVLPLEKGRLTVKKQFVAPSFNLMIAALLQVVHIAVVVALILFGAVEVMDWYTYGVQIIYLIIIFIGAMKTDQAGRHFRMTITASFMVIVCLLTDMGSTVLLGYKPFFVVLKAVFLWGGIFKQLFSERKLSIFSTFAKTSTAQG
eukprot:NODE_472_length_8038_cov_0.413150.p2 type:complete len:330 gc:universal NODE_472_length_8038_cov_0.413150:2071-1082(-)